MQTELKYWITACVCVEINEHWSMCLMTGKSVCVCVCETHTKKMPVLKPLKRQNNTNMCAFVEYVDAWRTKAWAE